LLQVDVQSLLEIHRSFELGGPADKGKVLPLFRALCIIHECLQLLVGVPEPEPLPYQVLCELLEGRLADVLNPEFRQNVGNVIQEQPVWCDDHEILRYERLLVIVDQVCDPVEGNSGLPASCSSL